MKNKQKIVIVVLGGVVTDVYSSSPSEVEVIDFDNIETTVGVSEAEEKIEHYVNTMEKPL